MDKPSPFSTGAQGRCPECGEGAMFDGLLKIAPRCDVCGADFEIADVGDGASVFVLFIVGFLAMVLFLLVEAAFHPAWWVHLMLQLPFVPVACIATLRPIKGLLFALQYQNDAREAQLDD
ncbi:protein of unknown function DUF983 [Maricaulis maris MCS10]|jgi:uncharacterized protein (DUF983 family)|uniref:DUF983 domain-containing protein n=2 Tax=Maricaulaceae TaxID=2800061 RepID=Q0AMH3_MARMM|nr:protein of unknown function DUF983 [Maricaulis maris MCS10]MAC90294.1 DUF983 domain-containing protein [Maricaulis sp.]